MSENTPKLSRRERQIMDVLYARGRATAQEIEQALEDAPSNSAIRTLLRVLEDKGHVRHEVIGRVYLYAPTLARENARKTALRHLIDTFFEGSVEDVVSTLLQLKRNKLPPEEAERIARMIEDAKRKGR